LKSPVERDPADRGWGAPRRPLGSGACRAGGSGCDSNGGSHPRPVVGHPPEGHEARSHRSRGSPFSSLRRRASDWTNRGVKLITIGRGDSSSGIVGQRTGALPLSIYPGCTVEPFSGGLPPPPPTPIEREPIRLCTTLTRVWGLLWGICSIEPHPAPSLFRPNSATSLEH
jgi:hypothetical protein